MTPSNGEGITNGKNLPLWKMLEIVILLLLAINTGLTGWSLNKAVSMSERISTMEANRFTASDGLEVWKALSAKADSKDIPAPETLRRLDYLEKIILSSSSKNKKEE